MMIKYMMVLLMALILPMSTLAGCYKMGKATGNAVDEVEEGAGDFEEGYEEGKD